MGKQYVLTSADADSWRKVLPANACVMGSVEYARVIEQQSHASARLFVYETDQSVITYPFFLRPTDGLPFIDSDSEPRWDTFTPEYTGPLYFQLGKEREPEIEGFADLFTRYCSENNIVAEFAHLSPWRDFGELLNPAFVLNDRELVYVDLTLGEQGLWTKSLNSDSRRQTRQGEKAGVRVRWAKSHGDICAYHRLYANTMERRQALEKYRFPLEYFVAIFETMPENAFITLAEYQNRLVAGGLYFYDETDVYWHLSAADLEFSRTRPVNKYLWETMRWAVGAGKQRMLLGGGYKGSDGVFHFKSGFSPLRAQFCTYRRIHDDQAYKKLNGSWINYYNTSLDEADYFPAYRSIPKISE